MSSPQRPVPPTEVRERSVCMCVHGLSCSAFAAGHAVHLVQARLVATTAAQWRDAIVESVSAESGELVARIVEDGTSVRLWNSAGVAALVVPGEPVAVHPRYHALSAAGRVFNVAILD